MNNQELAISKLTWFKRVNAILSSKLGETDMSCIEEEQTVFWSHFWWSWMMMLIPVAGISGVYILMDEAQGLVRQLRTNKQNLLREPF